MTADKFCRQLDQLVTQGRVFLTDDQIIDSLDAHIIAIQGEQLGLPRRATSVPDAWESVPEEADAQAPTLENQGNQGNPEQ